MLQMDLKKKRLIENIEALLKQNITRCIVEEPAWSIKSWLEEELVEERGYGLVITEIEAEKSLIEITVPAGGRQLLKG